MEMPKPQEVIAKAKALGWTDVRLSFSAGKDSIVAMHALLRAGIKVHPVYFAPYPGLPLMERAIQAYEKLWGIPILRLPHPWVFTRARNLIYQTPWQVRLIEQLNCFENMDFEEILEESPEGRKLLKLPTAICIKALDSQNRFRTIWRKGTINREARQFYPVGCVSNKWIWTYLLQYKIPVPSFYRQFGESFDLPRPDMMQWLKQHDPASYEQIIRAEPLRDTFQKARRQVGQQ